MSVRIYDVEIDPKMVVATVDIVPEEEGFDSGYGEDVRAQIKVLKFLRPTLPHICEGEKKHEFIRALVVKEKSEGAMTNTPTKKRANNLSLASLNEKISYVETPTHFSYVA
ncbi:unnamed protein product [Microthlaspi erraticum]|uniref:Uncharacterized protein n=1 Tax=Microthlaspi erraticum TaxID=1685480 RepID=A0A6D2K9D4_9BRAS|nr:unnamed protein product [Microthlaspi erraticum]